MCEGDAAYGEMLGAHQSEVNSNVSIVESLAKRVNSANPAKAGVQKSRKDRIPASAGMTPRYFSKRFCGHNIANIHTLTVSPGKQH